MTKIKFGDKEYQIQFGYIATAKSGIISKIVKMENSIQNGLTPEVLDGFLMVLPEIILVGLQKFHRDKFGYNYDTGEGREEAISKVGDLVDAYFDNEDSDFYELFGVLTDELMDNSFLSKMFQQVQGKQDKNQRNQRKAKAETEPERFTNTKSVLICLWSLRVTG